MKLAIAALALASAAATAAPGDATLLDDFRAGESWKASGSDQVEAHWRADARGRCLDYDFHGVSGYAVVRRALPPLDWPADYEFRLRVRGHGPANHFQFKLTDAGGENVWWVQHRDARFGAAPRELRIKRRQIQFAWGPTTDQTLRQPEALELVVATGSGAGRGSLCFEQLTLIERVPAPPKWPTPTLRSGGSTTAIDLHTLREFSGVQLHWPASDRRRDYALQAQGEDGDWQTLARVRRGAGPIDALFLPDSEARRLRLRWTGAAHGLPRFELMDAEAWHSSDDATAARALALPRGLFPRTYRGEQNYWTLFGVDGGGQHAALVSEDGAIEPRPGAPSVEPFVLLHGSPGRAPKLVSWADVRVEHRLAEGYLPLPQLRWSHPAFTLDIEAGAAGDARRALGLARYTLRATGARPLKATLLLVSRPWQVNPPQQFLNRAGGASPIYQAGWVDGMLSLNRSAPSLQPIPAPARVLAGGVDDWPLPMSMARGARLVALQDGDEATGPGGRAEAAMSFPLTAAAGRDARVALAWSMAGDVEPPTAMAEVDAAFETSAAAWRQRLNRVGFELPAPARRVHDTLRSALAQILLSRRGPALQPGTRSYARSWVRDGAMMVAGLLRLGETDASREFVDWYAKQLFDNGKVPCCVDERGADPVPENDSHGQFIYAVAELWRFTHDRELLQRHWPAVQRATRYMEQLRQSERKPANPPPFFGLMPASISHEGYSAKPMHSYWDDFWALRGYKDAVLLAQALGDEDSARTFAAWREEFGADLGASIRASATQHRIDFIPGAAELGDFDATSTTVALNPAQAQGLLPEGMLEATFERYWRESLQRRENTTAWRDYTPYELRSIGALVRLQQPARALEMLDFFFADQRPAGWNQWAEVVMRDPREKHFLGDMPHAWVASDAIRSLLDLFVHDSADGRSLVIAAGLPEAWLREGVAVRDLPTPHGLLGYRARREPGGLRVHIEGGLVPPADGLHVRWHGRDHRVDNLPADLWLPDSP